MATDDTETTRLPSLLGWLVDLKKLANPPKLQRSLRRRGLWSVCSRAMGNARRVLLTINQGLISRKTLDCAPRFSHLFPVGLVNSSRFGGENGLLPSVFRIFSNSQADTNTLQQTSQVYSNYCFSYILRLTN